MRNDGNERDGIYVGRRKGKDLLYAGKVDHGFDRKSSAELRKRLTPLIRKTQLYARRSRTRASGSSPSCWRKSNTGQSPPRARCDTRSTRALREDL
jgi:bifunctional non-homologous end joining protein LigD